ALAPKLDSFCIGAGAEFTAVKNLVVEVGIFKPFYFSETYKTGGAEFKLKKEKQWLFGINGAYKFL
ncbi:MAG: hypothetical protein LBC67_02200, partial [Spirochaetales bacterium]|nr:hypothetical protein [Spirochaetales bacterium]